MKLAVESIQVELEERLAEYREAGKLLEAQRLEQRTRYDIEMMMEMGFCSGIENYSRHLTGLPAGHAPYTVIVQIEYGAGGQQKEEYRSTTDAAKPYPISLLRTMRADECDLLRTRWNLVTVAEIFD